MANIVEPEDLPVRRIQKRHSIAIEVEWRMVNALRVTLGLCEHVLRTQRDLFRLDDAEELAVYDQRIVGGTVGSRELLDRMTTISAERSCGIEGCDFPAPLLQAGINPALTCAPFVFR